MSDDDKGRQVQYISWRRCFLYHFTQPPVVCLTCILCDLKSLSVGEKKKGLFNSLKKKKKGRKSFLSRSLTHISEMRSHRRSVNFDLKQDETTNADTNQPHDPTHSNQKHSNISLGGGQAPESPSGRPENLSFDGESSPVEFSPGSTVSVCDSVNFRFLSFSISNVCSAFVLCFA